MYHDYTVYVIIFVGRNFAIDLELIRPYEVQLGDTSSHEFKELTDELQKWVRIVALILN